MIPFIPSSRRVRELTEELARTRDDLIGERTAHALWEDIAREALSRAGAYRGRRELRKDAASFRVLAEQRKHELLKYVGRE